MIAVLCGSVEPLPHWNKSSYVQRKIQNNYQKSILIFFGSFREKNKKITERPDSQKVIGFYSVYRSQTQLRSLEILFSKRKHERGSNSWNGVIFYVYEANTCLAWLYWWKYSKNSGSFGAACRTQIVIP